MKYSKVYPLLIAKAERKGRSKEEVHMVTTWMTGYSSEELDSMLDSEITYAEFFGQAPAMNPNRELTKGKAMEKILRK